MWSTAFNKEILNLDILSTQRSESANNRLHGCYKPTSSLVECFLGIEKLIYTWRRSEHDEDFKYKEGTITLKYKTCPILKQMSKIYTRKIYSIFEATFMEGFVGLTIAE
ncbi:hypothetical protein KSP39_PZI011416 [Platanthera zijinensis]|uniref:Protein FAR1-RELATED SEQUENCE n=1 Tax=Platanthera zijinensis TaxID=2320716 RepID=A0AAP0BG38_9ASPA